MITADALEVEETGITCSALRLPVSAANLTILLTEVGGEHRLYYDEAVGRPI